MDLCEGLSTRIIPENKNTISVNMIVTTEKQCKVASYIPKKSYKIEKKKCLIDRLYLHAKLTKSNKYFLIFILKHILLLSGVINKLCKWDR